MTLADTGLMVTVTDAELPPQPRAPSASARISIEQNFHRLIPTLPRKLNIRPAIDPRFISAPKSVCHPTFIPPRLERPAHREPERAYRIEKIGPLWVVIQVHDRRHHL